MPASAARKACSAPCWNATTRGAKVHGKRAGRAHRRRSWPTLFLHGVADFAADTSGKNPPGCLLLQSGLSCGDSDIPDEMARHRAEKEAALCDRFEQARKTGDLPESANPAALARYLMAVSNGICVQAASGASAEELHEVAAMALTAWPGGNKKTAKPKSKVSAGAS